MALLFKSKLMWASLVGTLPASKSRCVGPNFRKVVWSQALRDRIRESPHWSFERNPGELYVWDACAKRFSPRLGRPKMTLFPPPVIEDVSLMSQPSGVVDPRRRQRPTRQG
eukprot:TRINITY_DN18852_c0_g1_i2.p2 TRINITY_DN18852_c0_g1~~TRINITY_DN18852_c0_g1_i2.p2  ORF type:complete len:130 (-),score=5.18 TRINITY_DN18852_c0_g1_i2:17-349(-)